MDALHFIDAKFQGCTERNRKKCLNSKRLVHPRNVSLTDAVIDSAAMARKKCTEERVAVQLSSTGGPAVQLRIRIDGAWHRTPASKTEKGKRGELRKNSKNTPINSGKW